MDIYLPVAELPVDALLLLAIGFGVGVLSGVFGVGGGFLMTPALLFIGIPATYAVGTGTLQIVASSVSGAVTQYRRGGVDLKMGRYLVGGGALGAFIGIVIFRALRGAGLVDTAVVLLYIAFLGTVGLVMLVESGRANWRAWRGLPLPARSGPRHGRLQRLPLRTRFPASRLYLSALLPVGLGAGIGVLTAVMGVGGGFMLIPAMVYILGMPTNVVVGTSLFQLACVAAITAVLQAVNNHNVDVVLGLLLIVGGVVGAQLGGRIGTRLRGEQLRLLLALLVLSICGRLAVQLMLPPADLFSLAG